MDFRDELFFLTVTIIMEAGGEPYEGKLAVAFVLINRGPSPIDNCFRAYQFSCWNSESPTRMNIDTIDPMVFKECFKSACAAYFKLMEDPSRGATHYLNEEVTRRQRGGTLPGWACRDNTPSPVIDEEKVTVRIGRHTFLRIT